MARHGNANTARTGEALRLVSVRKVYESAGDPVTALDGVSLALRAEAVAERMTHLGDVVAGRRVKEAV
jgi:hypothetical protein